MPGPRPMGSRFLACGYGIRLYSKTTANVGAGASLPTPYKFSCQNCKWKKSALASLVSAAKACCNSAQRNPCKSSSASARDCSVQSRRCSCTAVSSTVTLTSLLQSACPSWYAEKKLSACPQSTAAPGGGILCQQVKIIPTVGAVAGHSTAVGLGKELLQAAVQGVFLLHGLHVLI